MSVNERKHPDIVETPLDFLSDYEQRKFDKFRSLLSPQYDHITDFTLYRFLKINTFYTTPAQKQFLAYMQWRQDSHIDTILASTPPKSEVVRMVVPHAYHGNDLEGRPIYIEKTGKIAVSAMTDDVVLPRDAHMRCHIWGIEHLMQLCFERSLATHHRVETFTSIIDMEGLSLSHRSALPVLNACMTLDSAYYPEFIGKLFILNTPFLAPLVYNAVSPFVPREVRERMHIVSDIHQLTQHIAIDQLPVELDGTCALHGGHICVAEYDAAEINALVHTAHNDMNDTSDDQVEGQQVEGDGDITMNGSGETHDVPHEKAAAAPAKGGWRSWLLVR